MCLNEASLSLCGWWGYRALEGSVAKWWNQDHHSWSWAFEIVRMERSPQSKMVTFVNRQLQLLNIHVKWSNVDHHSFSTLFMILCNAQNTCTPQYVIVSYICLFSTIYHYTYINTMVQVFVCSSCTTSSWPKSKLLPHLWVSLCIKCNQGQTLLVSHHKMFVCLKVKLIILIVNKLSGFVLWWCPQSRY